MQKSKEHLGSTESLKNWIEPLRRHSWEMELLLTGFVLIGLLQLPDVLNDIRKVWYMKLAVDSLFKSYLIGFSINILIAGIRIMTVNLIILLLLRGFWIGIVGLSSAFPDGINFDRLSFNERFTKILRKRTLDTEQWIVRLDNICSSVFSLSFLIFFIIVSFGLYIVQIQILQSLNSLVVLKADQGHVFYITLGILISLASLFYLTGGLLKLIDFISIGQLKKIKKRWFAKPFFFISRYISAVTLVFAYRRIYYFLASNYPRKYIQLVLLGYLVISLLLVTNTKFNSDHIYYPQKFRNTFEVSYNEYENLRPDDAGIIDDVIIQSDVIKDDYIRLFIPYDVDDNKKLASRCPGLKPVMKRVSSNFSYSASDSESDDVITKNDVKKTLECFSSFYTVSIDDSTFNGIRFFFHRHPNNDEPGIIAHIPVRGLSPGYHSLEILEYGGKGPDIIQFWKE